MEFTTNRRTLATEILDVVLPRSIKECLFKKGISMNWEVVDQHNQQARIKVIGVGGAGGNAVIHMINHDIQGVDFICANTDTQALSQGQMEQLH